MYSLELRNLTFCYNNEFIFKDVNLKIPLNKFIVVVGPNGGGKSTLLKLTLGLLKPQKGEIRIFDHNVKNVYNLIGYVPQDSSHMRQFPITVEEVINMGFYNSNLRHDEKESLIDFYLDILELSNYKKNRVKELSTGQRQRVFLIRALVASPKFLVLDEPISGVDPVGQKLVFELLTKIKKEKSIFFVSHDLSIIPNFADNVLYINRNIESYKKDDFLKKLTQSE